jgi:hypothetical protein
VVGGFRNKATIDAVAVGGKFNVASGEDLPFSAKMAPTILCRLMLVAGSKDASGVNTHPWWA